MESQIRFKSGEMLTFIATRTFSLGNFDTTVANGSEVKFDGSTAEYAGNQYSFPNLRGAIKTGWLVLAEAYDEDDPDYGRPVSANIQVHHPTKGGNPMQPNKKMAISTTESDERVVGNATQHAADTKAGNKPSIRQKTASATSSSNVIEEQDGVPVRTLKTAAVSRTNMENAGAAIKEANKVQIDAGASINTEEAMLAAMPEDERETYLAQKASRRSQYIDTADRQVIAKVAAAKTATSEGITATSKVGGGVATADPVDPGGKAVETVHIEDGITIRNTNGPKNGGPQPARQAAVSTVEASTVDARLMVAKSICPTFPDNYDFNASSRKKLAFLEDFEDEDRILLAVFAAESDAFKATLQQEFPSAFAS